MDVDAVNGLDRDGFVAELGAVFEHSPWIAAAAWSARPFADATALHEAMVAVVCDAEPAQQLALLRAHPELAGQEAAAGRLAPASREEQAGAGLRDLTAAQATRMRELNAAYRARFGFPFIIAVRHHSKAGILAEFERRVTNPIDVERAAALEEVFKIARLRLDALLTRPTNR